jgi:DNA repair exonuclease SbcCD ATPase subunit
MAVYRPSLVQVDFSNEIKQINSTDYHTAIVEITNCIRSFNTLNLTAISPQPKDYQNIIDQWLEIQNTISSWEPTHRLLNFYPKDSINTLIDIKSSIPALQRDIHRAIHGEYSRVHHIQDVITQFDDEFQGVLCDIQRINDELQKYAIKLENVPDQIKQVNTKIHQDIVLDQAVLEELKKYIQELNDEIARFTSYIVGLGIGTLTATGIGVAAFAAGGIGGFFVLPFVLALDAVQIWKIVDFSDKIKADKDRLTQKNNEKDSYVQVIGQLTSLNQKIEKFIDSVTTLSTHVAFVTQAWQELSTGTNQIASQIQSSKSDFKKQDWYALLLDVSKLCSLAGQLIPSFETVDISPIYAIDASIDITLPTDQINKILGSSKHVDLITYMFPNAA